MLAPAMSSVSGRFQRGNGPSHMRPWFPPPQKSIASPQPLLSLLSGSFGPSLRPMARGSRASVEPGQRFMQNNVAWVVSRVTPVGDILHAEIVKVGDATVRKLISVRALIEGFEPQPE